MKTFRALPPALAPYVEKEFWAMWRQGPGKNGRLTKVPYQARRPSEHASSNDPATWSDFPAALRAYEAGHGDGVVLCLLGSKLTALDLDDCRNAATGEIEPAARDLIARAKSYVEVTPSGTGLRIIGKGSGAKVHRKQEVPGANGMSVESYRDCERFITITGNALPEATPELADNDLLLDQVVSELDAAKSKKKSKKAKGKRGNRKLDLDGLIRNGEGGHFGGDRSRAVWLVINQLLEQSKSADEIVAVLIDPANGISAHCLDQPNPEQHARRQVEKAQQERDGDPAAEIGRLARLSAVEYEHQRKAAADMLGMRTPVLDKLVEDARTKLKDERPDVLFEHWNVEAANEPVDGGILLRAIKETIRRYVFMSEDQAVAATLWVLFSWLHEYMTHSPLLYVTSPEQDSGKTTLLGVLNFLTRRSLLSVDISGAALFRSIAKWQPTFIVDEADDTLDDNPDLRSVINGGWTRGQGTIRCHWETHQPERFNAFAPKVVAMKGRKLPATTLSRSIVITMKPRRASDPKEHVEDFDHLDNETFARLRSQAARWSADNAEAIAGAKPEIPAGFHNRRRANWKPLLAIAEAGGGKWKTAAWTAARAIEAVADTFDPSVGVELLQAIKAAFEARAEEPRNKDRITAPMLNDALVADKTAPWATYNKGKEISQAQVARLLKPYGIPSRKTIRWDDGTRDGSFPKGYLLEWFADAFERFCTSSSPGTPENLSTMPTDLFSQENSLSTSAPRDSDVDTRNPFENNDMDMVDKKSGGAARSRSDDLLYTGPVVAAPDPGPDPLDEHGAAVAPDDTRGGLGKDRRLELKAWRDRRIAEGERPADVDDALRTTIQEEIADLNQVETELERVKVLSEARRGRE